MRYYSVGLARFTYKDLLFERLRYGIAANNPVRYKDPFGLSCSNVENCETCDPQKLRDCYDTCLRCCDEHDRTRNTWLTIGSIVLGVAAGFISKNPSVGGVIGAGYVWLTSNIRRNAEQSCIRECDDYFTGTTPKACNQGTTTPADKNCPKGEEHCEEKK